MNRLLRIKGVFLACLIAAATPAYAMDGLLPPNLPGQWHGALQTAAGTFVLELTVKRDAQGALAASIESIDQAPGQPIPVSRVHLEQDRLKLEIGALAASYEGRFDGGKDAWLGSWQQGMTLPLTWTRGPLPRVPRVDGLDGTWRAALVRNGQELRLILRIATSARGTRAKLDSPDMGIAGLDVTDLSREGQRVQLRVPVANVSFDATFDAGTMRLAGAWKRDGQLAAVVTFSRSADSSPVAQQRPQTPRAPFPYASETVQFRNANANIMLAGTLTTPLGTRPSAAALLISGSGPQDRDETLFGHKPFEVLADHLARHGIAALRVDDRGVGKSGGDFGSATIADFSGDVQAAIDFLQSRPEIDSKAIGLIGHSEGGIVGPLAALRTPAVAYLVLLAAPGTPMSELLLSQVRTAGVMQGQDAAALAGYEAGLASMFEVARQAENRAAARTAIGAMLTPERMRQLGLTDLQKPAKIDELSRAWLRDVLRYDATATLGALNMPILALNGSLDRQVPAQANLAAIRRATAGNPDATIMQLDKLNHLFQTGRSGAIAEYAEIGETFALKALDTISAWINSRFGRSVRPAINGG